MDKASVLLKGTWGRTLCGYAYVLWKMNRFDVVKKFLRKSVLINKHDHGIKWLLQ
jgi:hypothetical protein